MKNKLFLLLASLIFSGCSNVVVNGDHKAGDHEMTNKKSIPPQLWSGHKSLDIPVDVCALKGKNALKSLGFTGVVQNGNYSYGNFNDNRAAVKCIKVNSGSFVYLAVAGPEKAVVEKLRNELTWQF